MTDLGRREKEARRRARRGEATEALRLYIELLEEVDAPAATYDGWVAEAERLAAGLPDGRPAAYLALYRRDTAAALERLPELQFPVEHAHAEWLAAELQVQKGAAGTAPVDRRALRANARPMYAVAAVLFLKGRMPVLAARAYAAAGERELAQRQYRQLLVEGRLDPYEQALCHFELAVQLADPAAAPDALRESRREAVAAGELLELLADSFEAAGEIDRALDCYRLYIQLGQALGRFENIVEGAQSSLRLLIAERRTLDALMHYEELLEHCAEAREHHLYAVICREAAELLDRLDLPWGALYRRRAGTALQRAAADNRTRGGPAPLSESALLQAVAAWNTLDDFEAVRHAFEELASLPLPEAQRERYLRLSHRYGGLPAPTEVAVALPPALRPSARQPPVPIWELDLVEWQAAGEPGAVCLGLLANPKSPLLTRRAALRVLLYAALPVPGATGPAALEELQRRTVAALGSLRCYEALRPLERLFETHAPALAGGAAARRLAAGSGGAANPTPAARLRRQIIEVLPRLPFRRSLGLIVRGLADPDLGVYATSLEALARASFPEAVSGLVRLYRERPELEVRRAILSALGRSRDPRGHELLLDVLREEPEPLRGDALRFLLGAAADDPATLRPFIARLLAVTPAGSAAALQSLLQAAVPGVPGSEPG